jgi:hypothetical protein
MSIGKLSLETLDHQVEFQLATWEALEKMQTEFEFHGYVVLTMAAVDAVNDMVANRTYH